MKNKQLIIGIILAVMSLVCIAVALYGPIKNNIDKENLTTTAEYTGENGSEIYTGEDESAPLQRTFTRCSAYPAQR